MIPPAGEELVVLALRLLMAAALAGFVAAVAVVAVAEASGLVRAAIPAASSPSAAGGPIRLMVLDGGRSALAPGMSWPLAPGTFIGRRQGNAIAIDDPFLSGEHAEIVHEAGSWWVRDRDSTNGTLLNGAPVAALTAIRPGDVLQFGHIRLQVVPGEDPSGGAR